MISNSICPYCRKAMIKAENNPLSQSVEHLIPNAALTRKRKNNEGDFYACRKCNSEKSNIDYVLGVLSKCQSSKDELSANTLTEAVLKNDNRAQRFIDMANTARDGSGGIHMSIPIGAADLLKYMEFLGKGIYFKKYGSPLNPKSELMLLNLHNRGVTKIFEEHYISKYGVSPYRHLELNEYSEVINSGEAIIYAKNKSFMVLLHDYTCITIKILSKSKRNEARVREKKSYIQQHFKYGI